MRDEVPDKTTNIIIGSLAGVLVLVIFLFGAAVWWLRKKNAEASAAAAARYGVEDPKAARGSRFAVAQRRGTTMTVTNPLAHVIDAEPEVELADVGGGARAGSAGAAAALAAGRGVTSRRARDRAAQRESKGFRPQAARSAKGSALPADLVDEEDGDDPEDETVDEEAGLDHRDDADIEAEEEERGQGRGDRGDRSGAGGSSSSSSSGGGGGGDEGGGGDGGSAASSSSSASSGRSSARPLDRRPSSRFSPPEKKMNARV